MKKIISLLICLVLLFGITGVLSSCVIEEVSQPELEEEPFSPVGRVYYISSSTGDDSNDALTKETAWKSFKNLKNVVLTAGDRVLLKRGDEWNERLEIYGGGSEEHRAIVSSYGYKNEPKPRIKLNNTIDDICVLVSDVRYDENLANVANRCDNLIIENLDIRNAYLGIYFRTLLYYNVNLTVRNLEISEIWAEGVSQDMSLSGAKDAYWAGLVKANLPTYKIDKEIESDDIGDKIISVTETGGGANEWLLPSAVLFTGGWTNVEFGNIIMNNAMNGLELIASKDIWVHDVIATGGTLFRSQHCTNLKVERSRLLSTNERFSFWGGMTGSYLGTTKDSIIMNNELSYCLRNGAGDGCGMDYETQCWNTKVDYNVFHHNDSGSLLIMELHRNDKREDLGFHQDITFNYNLSYNNLRDIKTQQYSYEVLMRNHGTNNISISYNDFYTPYRTKWGLTNYIGCNEDRVAASTIKEGNNQNSVNNYRTRFSFNKDGNGEGFKAHTGTFTVANGVGKIESKGNVGAIYLSIPQNGFCYKNVLVSVSNNAKGSLYFQYSLSDGTVMQSEQVKINGKGNYIVSLGDDIKSSLYDIALVFLPSQSGGVIEMDYIQFLLDITASAKKIDDNTIEIAFGGDSVPFVSDNLNKNYINVGGYTVTAIEKYNYNTIRVTVNEKVGNLKNLKIATSANLFVRYFADIIKGLDCDRTAADDAALLGCQAQSYYYNGSISLACK